MYIIGICVFLILLILSYILLYFRFVDDHELVSRRKAEYPSLNDNLRGLTNANGINNIPGITINTNNDQLQMANSCAKGPVRVSDHFDDYDCIETCSSSNAYANVVDEQNEIYVENKKLNHGTYCVLGRRPLCNPRTTIVMKTVNSVVCRSKFPNLFGGKTGNDIVACKNTKINDPLNGYGTINTIMPCKPTT